MVNEIAANFLSFSAKRMKVSQSEIACCLDKLTEEQMSYRGGDHENSITNLLLHLAGNIRQWAIHGVGGQPDIRQRDEEFSLRPNLSATEARTLFNTTVEKAAEIIANCNLSSLSEVIDPQPTGRARHLTVLEVIYRVVGHLEHHTGQIILLTKQLTHRDLDLSIPRKR